MKLLFCEYCQDMFKLGSGQLRSCECGCVKGRYINDREAEVSPEAVSIAISNVALEQAIEDMRWHQILTGDQAGHDDYRRAHQGRIEDVWVRPNSGPGNPRTRLLREETGSPDGSRDDQALSGDHLLQSLAEHIAARQEAAAIIRLVLGPENKEEGGEDE
jgi:hypothetical protein